MLDFTSALYLGMWHSSEVLRPWKQFTTGMPTALATPPEAGNVARKFAMLQGCERATLATSTLHVFWDLFVMLAGRDSVICMDAETYPIVQWGIERAAARGVSVRRFRTHEPDSLRKLLRHEVGRKRALIVAEGFCPGCGTTAPLADFLAIAREREGWLILDDTQAVGIFGLAPGPNAPYGRSGGGMLQHLQIRGPEVISVSSLAKGLGVPLAVVAGSRAFVDRFESHSETRVHCSPPSIAALRAAEHALEVNRRQGDVLRLQLARLVRDFRARMRQRGIVPVGGLFPVQTLVVSQHESAAEIHSQLLRSGIRCVLHRLRHATGFGLSFLITARHTAAQVAYAAEQVGATFQMEFHSPRNEVSYDMQ